MLRRMKKVNRSFGGSAVLFMILCTMSIFMMLPLVLMVGNSFKPLEELWIFPPKLLPMVPTLENYKDMFNLLSSSWVPFSRYLFNTLFITVAGTCGVIVLSSMCAYPLAKRQFPGKNLIFRSIVMALMFNSSVTGVQNYLTISKLEWINTYMALIVPALAGSLGLYLMKQFMEQIPDALIEAAKVDGAGQWITFWKIVMPLVKPAWLTLVLLTVQSLWNMGESSYVFNEELKTMPYALSQIVAGGIARAGVGAAISVFLLVVPVAIFIITQSNVIQTMTSAGIKE